MHFPYFWKVKSLSHRDINLQLPVHKFPTCTLGKISLSYKRSYDGKLMAAMLNVIEVLLSKICVSPAMYFMKYSIKKKALTAHIIFLVPQCSLTSLLTVFVW